jgi:arsenate reductase
MSATLYGFRSCDTVKKARAWLDARGVKYDFFDYRAAPLDPKVLDGWFARAGWESVFNRNSATFKELPGARKANIDEQQARAMILAETNLIKRPVLDLGDRLLFGFKPGEYQTATGAKT